MPLPSTGARPSPIDRLRVRVERVHPELWTVGKYLAVGATGVVVNLLTFSAATVWNFVWNYLWTFRSQHSRTVVAHGIGFAAASLAALAINLAVLYVLVSHVDALIAQFCGILSGTAVSFSLNRWANFVRPESPTVLPKDGSSRR